MLISARRAGLSGSLKHGCYQILGDDVVVTDDNVAIHYKQILNHLGVDISDAKSHTSRNMYEFAKR